MSPDTGRDTASNDGFGMSLAARVRPRALTIRRSVFGAGPGGLAGRTVDFAASLAVPSMSQWGIEPSTLGDPSQQNVRPPIDNWLWGEADQPEPDPAARTPWNPARNPANAPRRAPRPAPRRGLPLTTRRRQHTVGGARTAPGAIARTLSPNTDTSAPLEAPAVLRRQRGGSAAPQRFAPAERPAAAAGSARQRPGSAQPDGLPDDLQLLQRTLLRKGFLEPSTSLDEPDVVRFAPLPSTGNGGVSDWGVGANIPPWLRDDRSAADTQVEPLHPAAAAVPPRPSAEGRIDRSVVTNSRARRAAADPAPSGRDGGALTPRPSPFAARDAATAPARDIADAAHTAGTDPRGDAGPASAPHARASDPIVRRNADLGPSGRPQGARPAAAPRSSSPAVVDRAAIDRVIASRPAPPTRGTGDASVRRAPSARAWAPVRGAGDATVGRAPSAAPGSPADRAIAGRPTSPVPVRGGGDAPVTDTVADRVTDTAALQDLAAVRTAMSVAVDERPATAELPVAPAAGVALAERPAERASDRPAERESERASERPAERSAERASAAARTEPQVRRDDEVRRAVDPAVVRARSEAVRSADPDVVQGRAVESPRPARGADPASPQTRSDEVSRAADPVLGRGKVGRDGMVVRRLGEVVPRPDTSTLPVRPAVEPASPADPERSRPGAVSTPAVPAVESPVLRRAIDDRDGSPDRLTAADVRRMRATQGPATQPSSAASVPLAARALRGDPRLDVRPPLTGIDGPTTTVDAVAPGPAPRAERAERVGNREPVPSDDVIRRDARADRTGDRAVPGDGVIRRSVRTDRAGLDDGRSGTPPTVTPPTDTPPTVTRRALRRTLEHREPVRRRPMPLPNAGVAGRMPAAIEPASRASAIETVMRESVASEARPAEQQPPIAERFMTELSRQRSAPRALPARYHEMSTLIAGTPQVRVANDVVSRQALRSVGKVAATVDDVIHLDRPIGQVRPDVIAHELTHVAHRSPEPRFFDDDRPSREEQRAEQVAKLMRASAAPSIVRRSPAADQPVAPSPQPSSPGTISAESLAAQITGGGSDAVQRQWNATRPRGAARGVALGGARAAAAPAPQTDPAPAPVAANNPAPVADAPSQQAAAFRIEEHFDRILELLQDRVLAELERRGGRLRGGF